MSNRIRSPAAGTTVTSRRGVFGAALILMSLPMALLLTRSQGASETLLHVLLGAGFVIVSLSVFDFGATRWVGWVGSLGIGLLGAIFLLQGASDVIHDAALHALAYDVLGQTPERVLPDLFFIWCVVMLVQRSRGGTRRFGACVITLVVAAEILDYGMALRGGDAPGVLKLVDLLLFAWLLLEARRPRSDRHTG